MKQLSELFLNDIRITDSGLEQIKSFTTLQVFWPIGVKVTDEAEKQFDANVVLWDEGEVLLEQLVADHSGIVELADELFELQLGRVVLIDHCPPFAAYPIQIEQTTVRRENALNVLLVLRAHRDQFEHKQPFGIGHSNRPSADVFPLRPLQDPLEEREQCLDPVDADLSMAEFEQVVLVPGSNGW